MNIELAAAAVAFAVALPLTPLLRLPTKVGRKGELMPRVGGFSILAGFVIAIGVLALFSSDASRVLNDDRREFLTLVACGAVVGAVGARDDFRDLDWRIKLTIHFLAALGIYLAGYRVGEMTLPGGGAVALGWTDPVVSILWVMGVTNAINLIDGRDGVAAGVAALVSGTMAYIAFDLGHDLIAMLFAALAGASLGFVPWNLPRAKRFLGDSGAYFLGFMIAGLSISGFVDTTGRVPLYIPLLALGLPVLDTGVAFLRRFLDGRHPFKADFDHFHDRLERNAGFGPLKVTLTCYAITALFCAGAVAAHWWYKSAGSAIVGLAVGVFAVGLVLVLGYGASFWHSTRVTAWRGAFARNRA
ncbi:MAG: undecaprenyl/decaprenyl-phosphate alpha-N-acetylglucosaminyl 1-phosphate transferase [Dehalococcoidia bacterium]|nr:undecaprenyl/decaprenyl-phosphate alpha-N-acetylglucosaminyl 1-phosphate transferase [Dehalococcoidia bacterium]